LRTPTYATAILAEAIKKIGAFDLILCGRQAADWDVGRVGVGVAELLEIPCVSIAQKIEVSDGRVMVERLVEEAAMTSWKWLCPP
jgi:electron transfer flavoprotein beta subunit